MALSGGDAAMPSFDIPAFDIKLAILRSNCRNRLMIPGLESAQANAEGNFR